MRMRIRKARRQLRLRQQDIADHTNLTLQSYQRFEARSRRRRFNPTILQLRAIAEALDIELTSLTAEPTPSELKELPEDERVRSRIYRRDHDST